MRHPIAHLLALLGVCVLAQAEESPLFEVNILAQEINEGMEMAIDKDGRVFVAERKGKVKLYTPATKTTTELIDLKSDTRGESGLIGIALDPNFEENHWIYLYHTVPFETQQGPYLEHHLGRFTFEDGKIDPASEKILLKVKAGSKKRIHEAGSIAFDAEGLLYLSVGDNQIRSEYLFPAKLLPIAMIYAVKFFESAPRPMVVMKFQKETSFRPAHPRHALRSTSWD